MKIRFFSEKDDWTTEGEKITDPDKIEALRRTVEDEGPIIVEHWLYRGASAPERAVFDDVDAFLEYLEAGASAGDLIYVWGWASVCQDSAVLQRGKCPDDQGRVPKGGVY